MSRLLRDDVDAPPLSIKDNDAVDQRKQAVVPGALDVAAGVIARAALADENAARRHRFAAVSFDAQALRGGIAPVAAGALTFLMSHVRASLCDQTNRV